MNTAAEEILLESDDTLQNQPSEQSYENVNLQLLQVQKCKQRALSLRVLENTFLWVKQMNGRHKQEYWVDIKFLEAQPTKSNHIAWHWGVVAAVCLLNTLGLWLAQRFISIPYATSGLIILLTSSAVFWLLMIYRSNSVLRYCSTNGRIPIAELLVNKPERNTYEIFVHALNQIIQQKQDNAFLNHPKRLASELAEHRRLRDTFAISEEQYEIAKSAILSKY